MKHRLRDRYGRRAASRARLQLNRLDDLLVRAIERVPFTSNAFENPRVKKLMKRRDALLKRL